MNRYCQKVKKMKHLCETCDWSKTWEHVHEGVLTGEHYMECRRYPPIRDEEGSLFPPVEERDWCGEHSELSNSRPFGRLPSSEYQGPGVPIEIKDISMADGPTKMGGTATVIIGCKEISIPVSPDDTAADISERFQSAIAEKHPSAPPVTFSDQEAASRRHDLKERIHDPAAFKVGDRVRVVGVAESREGGWNCDWVPEMGECIGKEFKITNTYNDASGFCLGWDSTCCWFPSFVLEKVTDDPKPEGPRNEEYSP